MNVFEKKQQSKVTLDDTVPLSACIETAQKQDDHVVSRVKTASREVVLLFFFFKTKIRNPSWNKTKIFKIESILQYLEGS